jgi:hypothetical protein
LRKTLLSFPCVLIKNSTLILNLLLVKIDKHKKTLFRK